MFSRYPYNYGTTRMSDMSQIHVYVLVYQCMYEPTCTCDCVHRVRVDSNLRSRLYPNVYTYHTAALRLGVMITGDMRIDQRASPRRYTAGVGVKRSLPADSTFAVLRTDRSIAPATKPFDILLCSITYLMTRPCNISFSLLNQIGHTAFATSDGSPTYPKFGTIERHRLGLALACSLCLAV